MTHVAKGSPAWVAAIFGAATGLALFGVGVWSAARQPPAPLPLAVALAVGGFAELVIAYFASRRERLAWGFAISLNGTAFIVFLFGIPKLGDEIGSRGLAALVPLLFGALTMLWGMSHREFSQK